MAFHLESALQVLGFHLVMHRDFPQWGFTVYFVAPVDPKSIPGTPEELWGFCMKTPGCIELTHNHGSEAEAGKALLPRRAVATPPLPCR